MLTDKAKIDFEKWVNHMMHVLPDNGIKGLGELFLNALIIEWLDTVGLYVSIQHYNIPDVPPFFCAFVNGQFEDINFITRAEATSAAIEYANNIYNEIDHDKQ